ncbi:hypothetical protein TR13x_04550 [Caloranaerobacter sp. TR13]|nr:hypothetical protein TR13x_04550 [Caloranaerobacter sp. TR13]
MHDIHSHILPSVDDGAKHIEEAVEMARIAEANGVKTIFATPHYIEGEGYKNTEHNKKVLDRLNEALKVENIGVKVLLGNEVFITPDIVKLLEEGEVSTLNNSRYLLVELPMFNMPIYTEDIIYELRLKGIVPIIAHPERNTKIMEDPNILYEFIKLGALAQLNLTSLIGYYGESVKKTAEILLKHEMIHFMGTDSHSHKSRALNITQGIEVMSKIVGYHKVDEIINKNPLAILNDEEININEPKRYVRKGKIRSILEAIVGR